jgi:predicted HTH domain antitoxin
MEVDVNLELSDQLLREAEITEADVRLAVAVQLYADRRICFEDACRLGGLEASLLQRELIRRNISVLTTSEPLGRRERQAV